MIQQKPEIMDRLTATVICIPAVPKVIKESDNGPRYRDACVCEDDIRCV